MLFSLCIATALLQVDQWSPVARTTCCIVIPSSQALVVLIAGVARFKLGVGYLASKLGCPVVPAFVTGTALSMPKGRCIPLRRQVSVVFGPPLAAPEDAASAADVARGDPEVRLPPSRKAALQRFDQEVRAAVVDQKKAARAAGRAQQLSPAARQRRAATAARRSGGAVAASTPATPVAMDTARDDASQWRLQAFTALTLLLRPLDEVRAFVAGIVASLVAAVRRAVGRRGAPPSMITTPIDVSDA